MPHLAVRLLGGFQVELDGEAVYAFKTDKARALLAYLVVESARPHRRETLAALLWPDRPDAVARANLRQALSYLRQALRDDSHSQSHGPGRRVRTPRPSFWSPPPTCSSMRPATTRSMRPSSRHSRPHRCAATTAAPRRRRSSCPKPFALIFWRGCRCPTARRSRPGCWTGRSTTTGCPSRSSTSSMRPSRGWGITSRPRPRRAGSCGSSPGWKRRTSAACGRWPWPGVGTKRCTSTRRAAAPSKPSWAPRRLPRPWTSPVTSGRGRSPPRPPRAPRPARRRVPVSPRAPCPRVSASPARRAGG